MNVASSANPQIAKILSQQKVRKERTKKLDWQLQFLSRLQFRVWHMLILVGLVFLAAVLFRILLTGVDIPWLFKIPPLPEHVGDTSTILAPFLAIAVAIERLVETGFDTYEKSLVSVARVLQATEKTDDWIENELRAAYTAVQDAAGKYIVQSDDSTLQLFEKAQQRLAEAESRLMDWVNSPEYVSKKRAIAIVVGLSVGLFVAVSSDLGIMRIIGVPAPRIVDMLATGLVIGAGPGPVHSLIGILESGKKAVDNLGDLAKGKGLRDAAQAVEQVVDQ